ncbi:MAG TPA: maltotransferase domain-containing protein, partial [Casimicrobiaceae bacterium]
MPPRMRDAGNEAQLPPEGRRRAVIEGIAPQVDGGRFPIKRIVGDRVEVEADCFADGHDVLACRLRHRREDDAKWMESPMVALGNDRWRGDFVVPEIGRYRYTVAAWVDAFL